MHELAIANEIVEQAKSHGNVKSIKLEVGDLSPLTAEELQTALGALVGWEVAVTKKKARAKCAFCGHEGEPRVIQRSHDFTLYACPKCSEDFPEVLEGDKIILLEVETK
jgi:Zn finger protein HypA/HybF involved in hydrogenase expression